MSRYDSEFVKGGGGMGDGDGAPGWVHGEAGETASSAKALPPSRIVSGAGFGSVSMALAGSRIAAGGNGRRLRRSTSSRTTPIRAFKGFPAPTAKPAAPDSLGSASNSLALGTEPPQQKEAPGRRTVPASAFFPDPLALPGSPAVPRGRPMGGALRRAAVVWFRSDLRIHDNEALASAFREASSAVPVYCFNPREYGKNSAGFQRTGATRARFVLDCVADLRKRLREIGSDLVVRVGEPQEVLASIVRQASADLVLCHAEVTVDEAAAQEKVEAAVKGEGAQFRTVWGSTLFHREDLPSKAIPANYAGFREMVKDVKIRKASDAPQNGKGLPIGSSIEPGEIPTLEQLGVNKEEPKRTNVALQGPGALLGGESEALRQLSGFIKEVKEQHKRWQGRGKNNAGAVASSGGGGGKQQQGAGGARAAATAPAQPSAASANFSCKISPWLALGCLSPRLLYEKVAAEDRRHGGGKRGQKKAAVAAKGQGGGVSWLLFELMWRDFFRFVTLKHSAARSPATTKATQAAPALA